MSNIFKQAAAAANSVVTSAQRNGTLEAQIQQMQANAGGAQREHVFEPTTIVGTSEKTADHTMLYIAGAALLAFLFMKKK